MATRPESRRRPALLVEQLLPITLLAVALLGAPVLIFSREGLPRLQAVQKELDMVEQENAQLRREITVLRGRVTRLRDDPAAIEQLGRAELGLVRQSEVVFQLPAEH
jgi:cell division protein FtsB